MKTRTKLNRLNQQEEVLAWKVIMQAFQSTYHKLEKNLISENCSISRFKILYLLYFEGPLRPMDIAEKSYASRPNITTFLKRMILDKLVVGEKSKEGKRLKYKLTAKGEKCFEHLFPRHIKKVSSIVEPMSPDLMKYLINLKEKADAINCQPMCVK